MTCEPTRPRYRVYRGGELVDEPTDLLGFWRDDLVGFLLGCSFTFEHALIEAGVPVRHIEQGRNVPMYRTNIPCRPAGAFRGPMVASMRPMTPAAAVTATRVCTRFPRSHGAPVHFGDPAAIGIRDLDCPDYGDPVEVRPGETPVFWACGVTPQAVAAEARPSLLMTHAPGHMFVTDLRDANLEGESSIILPVGPPADYHHTQRPPASAPRRRPVRTAMHPRLSRRCTVAVVSAVLTWTASAHAQKAPVPPNPAAPVLKPVAPHGAQRGTTIDLTLTGANLAEPTGLGCDFPAKVTIPPDNNNGKDPAKLLVRLEIPKDAPMGFHALRLATTHGMSNLRLFCVDDLPQVLQKGDNRTLATAQPVAAPCVVAGQTANESNDYYKITVAAGQRLSFEVLGRRLGSPIDPQLTLFDARTGHELHGGHSNDAPGLQTDPRLTYTFKEAGDYVIEIRDVSYKGGEDYFYRLRIGDFPCATTTLPLAIKRGAKATVRFAGPLVDGVAPEEVTAPADPAVQALWLAPRGANGLYGWPVSLALSDLDEALEQEPNNDAAHANRLAVPGAVTGRFEQKGDVDVLRLRRQEGHALRHRRPDP